MKLYISGPMSRVPEFNFPAFFRAEARLRAAGHDVINPASMDLQQYPDIKSWPGFTSGDPSACPKFNLRATLLGDLTQILAHADGVVVLPGWAGKRCAQLEVMAARRIGLPIFELDGMKEIEPRFVCCFGEREVIHALENTIVAQQKTSDLLRAEIQRLGIGT